MSPAATPVLAAGALCWRVVDGRIVILLVHRERHGDVSLPKGKVDPGESLPQTAAREIEEETGLRVALGAPLGTTEYTLPNGREKIVHYWTAEVDDDAHTASSFTPNDEVQKLEWLSLKKARAALTYPHDREVLERFQARVDNDTLRSYAIIALRHGKAISPGEFDGQDAERTLLKEGRRQAEAAAGGIAAFGPEKLFSSTAVRCVETVKPLAKRTGLHVKQTYKISQDAYENGAAPIDAVVARRLEQQKTVVLCSHGPVLPEIIAAIARDTNTPLNASVRAAGLLPTGGYAVVHLARDRKDAGIIAIEVHGQ
ncbi:8-oxo-dGTP diphosphatase [Homoserinimonas aerilata]|uniref:8-oxo-dGTP diphosphatase n=1 Tax=Homoserinimonas aerilata TaxID=1162970 RepID=A0A542YG31_9MICO|nr:NUDIX domain-containing protein [Homoserinimonas aerilata]TQL47025.1 8-oxo-dGTP diphosphatase [Homoserinimonas aerilata]